MFILLTLAQNISDRGFTGTPQSVGGPNSDTTWKLLIWCAVLIGLVVLGGGALMLFRRWLQAQETLTDAEPGFTLSDLRALRDKGELSNEEYEAMRERVIAKVKEQANKPKRTNGPAGKEGLRGGD